MPNWKKVIVSGSDATLNKLNIITSLTASGLNYPTTDGDVGQTIVTDGAGNLSFTEVEAEKLTFAVQNGESFSLPKGTPVHVTSTTNGTAIVIAASASVASKMPAHGILSQNLTAGSDGFATITGLINGVDTSAFSSGDTIYVAPTGSYTNVKPQGSNNLIQNLGIVKKVDATNGSGEIFGSGRSNDVPNLPTGKIWVGDGYTITSSIVHLDETNSVAQFTGSIGVTGVVSGSTFSGSFVGDGSGLTGISAGATDIDGLSDGYTQGLGNVFLGTPTASLSVTSGTRNTVLGCNSGKGITSGLGATIVGYCAAPSLNTATIAIGYEALCSATNSSTMTFIGYRAGRNITCANYNTGVGHSSLYCNLTGQRNTAFGWYAGYGATGGSNTFIGACSGGTSTSYSSNNNTAVGTYSLKCGGGSQNTALGMSALCTNTSGLSNVVIGHSAGTNLTGGTLNIIIGQGAQASSATALYEITLGSSQNVVRIPGLNASDGDVLAYCSTGGLQSQGGFIASSAISSSFTTGSNVYGPYGANSILSASYALTASHLDGSVVSASYALTASYAATASIAIGGSNTQVQFNDNGDLGASPNLTFDGSTLSVTGAVEGSTTLTIGSSQTNSGTLSSIGGGTSNTLAGNCGFIGAGASNVICSNENYGFIGGGFSNKIDADYSAIAGGHSNCFTFSGNCSFIGGGCLNCVSRIFSTIGGGFSNSNSADYGYGTIGGGYNNTISTDYEGCDTIAGGANNTITSNAGMASIGGGGTNCISNGFMGTIAGGNTNCITGGFYGAIGGGFCNTTNTSCGFIGGGAKNCLTSAVSSVIVGGTLNTGSGACGFIGGGCKNTINSALSFVGGGCGNSISSTYCLHTIVGGKNNTISGTYNTAMFIGGGQNNTISTGFSNNNIIGAGLNNTIDGSTNGMSENVIVGGSTNKICCGNLAFIGGGSNNFINDLTVAAGASVVGGSNNCVECGNQSIIGGGCKNTISKNHTVIVGGVLNTGSGACGFIGGGEKNYVANCYSIIAGGCLNQISTTVNCFGFIGGGECNRICTNSNYYSPHSIIVGGKTNLVCGACCGVIVGGQCNTLAGIYNCHSFVGGGECNRACRAYTAIVGGQQNVVTSAYGFIGGGRLNTISGGTCSFIGGGCGNTLSGYYLNTIVGGKGNTVSTYAQCQTIVGGHDNTICGGSRGIIGAGYQNTIASGNAYGAIVAGRCNTLASSYDAVSNLIGSGCCNSISSSYPKSSYFNFIGSGCRNKIFNGTNSSGYGNELVFSSAIVAGTLNTASAACSFIGGGCSNFVSGIQSFVGAGINNDICNTIGAFIGGGCTNIISGSATSCNHVIAGGSNNKVLVTDATQPNASVSAIGGGYNNCITHGGSVIAGGTNNTVSAYQGVIVGGDLNTVSGCYGFIGAGRVNTVNGNCGFIGGGQNNTICSGENHTVIGGGCSNIVDGDFSSIVGGRVNTIKNNCSFIGGGCGLTVCGYLSVIGGGQCNRVCNATNWSVIAGGCCNYVQGCVNNTIGGGGLNCIATPGYGSSNTIAGGQGNRVSGTSNESYNTIAGGFCNCICSGACCSAILGGANNYINGHDCSFIIGKDLTSTAANYTFMNNACVAGTTRTTTLVETSARKHKECILPLQDQIENIKQLEPVEFQWKQDKTKDIGFIAEEVEKVFPNLVSYEEDGEIHGVQYSKLTTVLVKALQQQQEQIDELKEEVKLLKQNK